MHISFKLLAFVVVLSFLAVPASSASTQTNPMLLFLPVVMNAVENVSNPGACVGICGQVTENGSPVAGLTIYLNLYDGTREYTVLADATDANGYYSFTPQTMLSAGEAYYVYYQNESDTQGRLWAWYTKDITSYTAGTNIRIGDFDIADIQLKSPGIGASVSLPATFQWVKRPFSPTDSYEFNLFDYEDAEPYFYTEPPLGYIDSYTLRSLPAGFSSGVEYGWEIWVYSPDGGFGISYATFPVTFNAKSGAAIEEGGIPSTSHPRHFCAPLGG